MCLYLWYSQSFKDEREFKSMRAGMSGDGLANNRRMGSMKARCGSASGGKKGWGKDHCGKKKYSSRHQKSKVRVKQKKTKPSRFPVYLISFRPCIETRVK